VRARSSGFEEQVRNARQVDAAIVDIEQAVGEVSGVSHTISEALGEQTSASLLISQKVERIAQMNEEAHKAISEVGQGTRELDGTSQEPNTQVASFRV
jgi:methyl-accepting chemotaxis protein